MKRKFGEKRKRKKRENWIVDTLLECIGLIEYLLLLPFRILIYIIRSLINLLNF